MSTTLAAGQAPVIARSSGHIDALWAGFDALLRRSLPYAVAAWATHDPAAGLSTSCTMSGLPKDPAREAALYRFEYVEGEPSTYLEMIASGRRSAILSIETDGDLGRAGRFANLLASFGVTDELRAILWADGTAWGSVTLYRTDGRFDEADAAVVEEIAPHAAAGVRLCLLRAAATRPEAVREPPGILEARRGGRVLALTDPGARWLAVGGPELVTAANILSAAIRANPESDRAHSRLVLRDGRVLSLHAASIASADGAVAVIVDRARPAAVSAMLVEAYGLTPRQREVLGHILLGRSMRQIARALGITEHTANDHRKAIYTRVGVSSRSELAALLQAEQYDRRAHAGVPPSPYGGFLEG